MSTGAAVELDFFGMEKGNSSKSPFQMLLEQRRNVRGVQTTISKINPQFLKTMIGSGIPTASVPVKDGFMKKELVSPPNGALLLGMENIPVFTPLSGCRAAASETDPAGTVLNAPLTIFYNGIVCVFDLPHDKAEMIMKLAEEGKSKIVESAAEPKLLTASSSSSNKQELLEKLNGDLSKPAASSSSSSNQQGELLEKLNGDLPIARKKSLQRFLAKRKERLTTISPYGSGSEYAVEKKKLLQEY